MNTFVLTILFPFLSFIILSASQGKLSDIVVAVIGVVGTGISALITAYLVFNFYFCLYEHTTFIIIQELWSWFKINDLNAVIIFRLDRLSLTMLSVITSIGFIINIYSIWYMRGHEGYSRFFAYINLFMCNMILLVLSDNLLLMYLGWEGVSLCSYLLIGFYYLKPKNITEAFKAFILTRFGDICLICALFIIYNQYSTFSISELLELDLTQLSNKMSMWISILILIGSIAKSAQIPLNTWLLGAMVGPTPVSALIHAATMVAAGVYLIDRLHNFFLITPSILYITGFIGAVTLITSSCSALFQSNIKKILAYSTIGQIGYMFLALSVKNWSGAIFHLSMHAYSKALLFLAAGSLIRICYNEQNIFKMGGLYHVTPFIYTCFLIGGSSLSGVPLITAGFYSKEFILMHIFSKDCNSFFLLAGLIGTFLTPIYIFRMIFIVFHGVSKCRFNISSTVHQYFSLSILLLLSTFVGRHVKLPIENIDFSHYNNIYFILISEILIFLGIWVASIFWLNPDSKAKSYIISTRLLSDRIIRYLVVLCYYGWGINWIYKNFFIKPYLLIARKLLINNNLSIIVTNFFILLRWIGNNLVCIENGKLNWYAASISIGVIIMLLTIFVS